MVMERRAGARLSRPTFTQTPSRPGAHVEHADATTAASETFASVEDLIRARGESLLRQAYLLTGNHADAEDLLQDVLGDVHRKWDRVERSRHPYAYVRSMLHNRFISSRRRMWHGERPTAPEDVADISHEQTDPTAAVDGREEMWQVLAELSPRMRTVLVLRYFEDLDDSEIARVLGISASTVRATASRGIAALRGRMAVRD